jgi:hypothetical protein
LRPGGEIEQLSKEKPTRRNKSSERLSVLPVANTSMTEKYWLVTDDPARPFTCDDILAHLREGKVSFHVKGSVFPADQVVVDSLFYLSSVTFLPNSFKFAVKPNDAGVSSETVEVQQQRGPVVRDDEAKIRETIQQFLDSPLQTKKLIVRTQLDDVASYLICETIRTHFPWPKDARVQSVELYQPESFVFMPSPRSGSLSGSCNCTHCLDSCSLCVPTNCESCNLECYGACCLHYPLVSSACCNLLFWCNLSLYISLLATVCCPLLLCIDNLHRRCKVTGDAMLHQRDFKLNLIGSMNCDLGTYVNKVKYLMKSVTSGKPLKLTDSHV